MIDRRKIPIRSKILAADDNKEWEKQAYNAGVESVGWFWPKSAPGELPIDVQWKRHLSDCWGKWFRQFDFTRIPNLSYPIASRNFLRGYSNTANIRLNIDLLLPTPKRVACVLTAVNEERTLIAQLNELSRLPFYETIVILNGSRDNSYERVRRHPIGATIAHFDSSLGYDVGRAIGARLSQSEIVLFLDGDMCIGIEQLLPFVFEAEQGADVVLNPLTSLLPAFEGRDLVSNVKQLLNLCLYRPELEADSLTAVPHALTRRAIEKIGEDALAVPPVAQVKAIRAGLSVVRSPNPVDVISQNRVREINVGEENPVERLIVGDHVEAMHTLIVELTREYRAAEASRPRRLPVERRIGHVTENYDTYSHP
jgi:hypothetical protein